MKKLLLQLAIVSSLTLLLTVNGTTHCEIPCGIYDDEARINMLLEHVTTIEKSMKQIVTIEKDEHHNANQLIRWVMNKEQHSNELQEIATQYFMTQRIKFDTKNYDKKLGLLHQMLVYAMKCKQSKDLAHTAKLTSVINEFKQLYFAK